MRTRTFKRIGLIVLLIALGLTLSGCDTAKAIVPKAGQTELVLNFSGNSNTAGATVQIVGNETISVDVSIVYWFYDVPENGSEYAAIDMAPTNGPRYVYLHLHTSKKPSQP